MVNSTYNRRSPNINVSPAMLLSGYLNPLLFGLASSIHCIGMCGGIVGALSMQSTQPVRGPGDKRAQRQWPIQLVFNLGRITTYVIFGALFGAVTQFLYGDLRNEVTAVQIGFYVFANLMLVALGLYLAGVGRFLAPFERAGQKLWRRLQPMMKALMAVRSAWKAFPLGLLWGFLPCGLVYSQLSIALVTGSAWRGAGVMLAFGLGTLPGLFIAGLAVGRFGNFIRSIWVRRVIGGAIIVFGILGLMRAPTLGDTLWSGVMCH